jgi:hypothetical protein
MRMSDFDGPALVHSGVSVRDVVQVGLVVEHQTGVDRAAEDVAEQLGDVDASWRRTAPPADVAEERLRRWHVTVRYAHHAHRRARTGNGQCRGYRLGRSHAFKRRVSADPAGKVHDGRGSLIATGGDYVGGTERLRDRLPVRMAAQGDDTLGTRPAGGQNSRKPDRPVADNRHDITTRSPGDTVDTSAPVTSPGRCRAHWP